MITRNWLMLRRGSCDDSTDDNKPLTYFKNKKKKDPPVPRPTTTPTGKISKRNANKTKFGARSKQKRVPPKKKQKAKAAETVLAMPSPNATEDIQASHQQLHYTTTEDIQSSHQDLHYITEIYDPDALNTINEFEDKITIEECELRSSINMDPLVLETSTVSKHQPSETPIEDLTLESSSNVILIKSDPESSTSDYCPTSSTQVRRNPLADFIIKIFDDIKGGLDQDTNEQDPQVRVQEWLVQSNTNNEIEQIIPQFKIPAPPQWREKEPPRRSSILKSIKDQINTTEIALRRRCLSWNYKRLSTVVNDKTIFSQFCGGCTRCRVMFKPEVFIEPQNVNLTGTDDDEDAAGVARSESLSALSRLPESDDHVKKLQRLMTEKGRCIFQTALLIKNKLVTNLPLLPTEHRVLRHVIVVLSQSNTPQNNDAYNLTRRGNAQQPQPSTFQQPCETREQPRGYLNPQQSHTIHLCAREFTENPIEYICGIRKAHPNVSLIGIAPPTNFTPSCTSDEKQANFKTMNQYIHRMLTRWGKATRELAAIRSIQDVNVSRYPLFEGLEVDLHQLFHTVQEDGGLEASQNNSDKWRVIAQKMNLFCRNKASSKLENIYLKYLLGYNALTPDERNKIANDVNKCWAQREIKSVIRAQKPLYRQEEMLSGKLLDDDDNSSPLDKVCAEAEECVSPGRYINYNSFEKLAQQVHVTYFPDNPEPSPDEVENEYWKIVISANAHVCVHVASVDAVLHRCGFTEDLTDPYGMHPWNLKRLHKNSANLLTHLAPIVGVSSTSVHYGMMFSTSCWHMDPTSIPWIEYLHVGPPKIWYSISADQEQKFRAAAEALCPFAVQNKGIWLPSDIIMIPPSLLRQYGIIVNRHVQYQGEYVVVYPNTYSACIDTGLTVSEGVYYAPHDWILDIERIYLNLRNSCEPSLFSMEQLLIAMARSEETPYSLLQRVHTVLGSTLRAELSYRQSMADKNIELISPQVFLEQNQRATATSWQIQENGECAFCRCHLYLSKVVGVTEGQTALCSVHGIQLFENAVSRNGQISGVYCIMLLSNTEIYNIVNTLKQRMLSSIESPV